MLYDDTNIHESINSPARAPLAGAPYNPGVSLAGTDEKGIKRNFQRRLLPNVTHTDDDSVHYQFKKQQDNLARGKL